MCSEVSPGCLCFFFPVPFSDCVNEVREQERAPRAPLKERAGHEPDMKIWLTVNYYASMRRLFIVACELSATCAVVWRRQACVHNTHLEIKQGDGTPLEVSVQRRGYQLALMQRGTLHCVSARFYRRFTVLLNSI